jgi:hypothetical protein
MTSNSNTRKPPITDLWIVVDEEQTLHYGLRQAWRWLQAEQPQQTAGHPAPVHTNLPQTQACPPQAVCLAI